MGGDRLSDLGWEVRSAGGRWFLSIGGHRAAKRLMTEDRRIFILLYYTHLCMCRYLFNLWSSRNKQWRLKVWITNALDLPKETEKLIMWNMDGGKDNCPRYNVIPDLALSSSFISYTLHRPLLLLRTQCQSPRPSVKPSNRHLLCHASPYALSEFPVKTHKVSGYILLLYVPPRSNPCCPIWAG